MACADCCSNNYCNYCNACANCHNNYTIVQNYVQAVRYNWHNKNLGSPSYRSMEIYLLNQCLKFCLCCHLMKWCWWLMTSLANWLLTNLSLDIKVLSWRRFQKINKLDGGAPLKLKEFGKKNSVAISLHGNPAFDPGACYQYGLTIEAQSPRYPRNINNSSQTQNTNPCNT